MSGLLGLADSAFHHLKGDHHHDEEPNPEDPTSVLPPGNLGDEDSAAVGTLTGRSLGGNHNEIGEEQMEPTAAERGEF
ncbi:hypothetical protein JCM5296_006456 [Sporobolomyces johnsonii]